jgi:hypothetical protein
VITEKGDQKGRNEKQLLKNSDTKIGSSRNTHAAGSGHFINNQMLLFPMPEKNDKQ